MPPGVTKSHKKDVPKNEESKQLYKITVRRLPSAFSQEELMKQIEPLDGCTNIWFRKANKLMEPWSFTRAYLAFENWEKAVDFKNKFAGYVFVDKDGNESSAIVELATHQEVPTNFSADSAKNDRRVGSLEERPEYKSFLDEFNSLVLHKVTNFDELIREVEEKEKRMEKGTVETPLVKFLLQQAIEKEKKRIARLEKHKPSMLQKNDDDKKKNGGRDEKRNRRKDDKFKKPKAEDSKAPRTDQSRPAKFDQAKPAKFDQVKPAKVDQRPEQSKPAKVDQSRQLKQDGVREWKRKPDKPKRVDDPPKLATNGISKKKSKDDDKEYAEFGNVKPKLLSRNQKEDDQSSDLPKNNDLVANNSRADEKPNDATEIHNSNNEDSKSADEKRRRHAQRPERQIYRPPQRNRDKDSGKKDKTPKPDKDVET